MASPEEYYAEFERIGADKVRENLKFDLFIEPKAKAAEYWLEQRDSGASIRSASKKQILETVAAIAAIIAAIAATIGATASIINLLSK
jgi:hypothetical protein